MVNTEIFQFSHSVVSDYLRPHAPQPAHEASLSITNSQGLPKLMSIELVMPSNHLILCCPLLLPPSIFPSYRVFSSDSALHIRWPKYWSFSFNISPFNEYSELISFRMDWLDLLAVQETLKSLLQHQNWNQIDYILCSQWWKSSQSAKTRLGADCGSDHELLVVKFRLKLKKVVNQILYDYTVKVRNRFKGIDLMDRVTEELWIEVHDIVQEAWIKTIPKKKKS